MSRPDWYSDPALVGFSDDLRPMHASPLAYQMQKASGSEDTNSRQMLRAMHCLILEGAAAFRRGYCVSPVSRRNGTAAYEAVKVAAAGRDILSQSEYQQAVDTAAAVRSHSWIADRLRAWSSGDWSMTAEIACRWSTQVQMTDPPAVWPPVGSTGHVDPPAIELVDIECKGIQDAVALNRADRAGIVIDCKAVPSLVDRPLFSHIERSLYHVQAVHYLDAVAALAPWVKHWRFLWLCYESSAPHDARWVELSHEDADYGRDVRTRLLRRVIQTRRTGDSAGRSVDIVASRLPAYETRDAAIAAGDWV